MREEVTEGIAVATELEARRRRRRFRTLKHFVRAKPLGVVGVVILIVFALTAVSAPVMAPQNPNAINYDSPLQPPGSRFLLGTDNIGRDVLSRVIFGARVSMLVGLLSVLFGHTTGSLLGLMSGYFGGKFDGYTQRVMDTIMAFPSLVLLLAIVAALGPSLMNIVIAIAFGEIPRGNRVVRSTALAIKETQYIEAARAVGCGNLRILLRHMLPQVVAPYLIITTAGIGGAILAEASLSFLGFGVPPPTPTWGAMLSGSGRIYLEVAPWMAMAPGIAITLVVYGINMFGDALRDVLDPRLRRS